MTLDELLDRRVPLAMALALCVQAGGIVWWVSARDAELHFQQRRIDQLEQASGTAQSAQTEILERLARIEERIAAQSGALDHIEKQVSRDRR